VTGVIEFGFAMVFSLCMGTLYAYASWPTFKRLPFWAAAVAFVMVGSYIGWGTSAPPYTVPLMVPAMLAAQALVSGIVLKSHPLTAEADYWDRVRLAFFRSSELRQRLHEQFEDLRRTG
jgi:hypothetical protein